MSTTSNPDHPPHVGRCGTDMPDCLLAYAANGDIHRGPDYRYRVVGKERDVTDWVYDHAEEEGADPSLLTLTYDGRVGLTVAGEERVAANTALAEKTGHTPPVLTRTSKSRANRELKFSAA